MGRRSKFSDEVQERSVRMVLETEAEHGSRWAATQAVASKIGCTSETLRKWIIHAEPDLGKRAGLATGE